MARMAMRDAILEVFDEGLDTLDVLLKKAAEHAETLMAGQSHFSHAQPTTYKGESIQDVLPVYKAPRHVFHAVNYMRQGFGLYRHLIDTLQVNRKRMREILANGYSGAPDLAIIMIRKYNYGGRRAHRICCNFVRIARERGIKPADLKAALLDEAARITNEPEPKLTDSEIQSAMTFQDFFETHKEQGTPNPKESHRLIGLRRSQLKDLRNQQTGRRRALEEADDRLQKAIAEITQKD